VSCLVGQSPQVTFLHTRADESPRRDYSVVYIPDWLSSGNGTLRMCHSPGMAHTNGTLRTPRGSARCGEAVPHRGSASSRSLEGDAPVGWGSGRGEVRMAHGFELRTPLGSPGCRRFPTAARGGCYRRRGGVERGADPQLAQLALRRSNGLVKRFSGLRGSLWQPWREVLGDLDPELPSDRQCLVQAHALYCLGRQRARQLQRALSSRIRLRNQPNRQRSRLRIVHARIKCRPTAREAPPGGSARLLFVEGMPPSPRGSGLGIRANTITGICLTLKPSRHHHQHHDFSARSRVLRVLGGVAASRMD
jgi:hypothetical protein